MMDEFVDFVLGFILGAIVSVVGVILYVSSHPPADLSWETDRLLLCTGPTLPQNQRALLAQKIKFNGTYFEVISNGNKYTYLPSKFETCLTLSQPAQAPQVNNSSPELCPLNEESNSLASR